jgi:hypothetical protein
VKRREHRKADVRIILKRILGKYGVKMWIGFGSHRIWSSGGLV